MPLVAWCDWCADDAASECRDCGTRWCLAHSEDHAKEHEAWSRQCHDCGFEFCACDEVAEERMEEADVDSARDWTMPERWGI